MGLRFIKSIKLPFGLRLNISKSGIGFSWGVKGYRKSISPKGKVRDTYTLPGTGLSYVKESSNHQKENKATSSKNETTSSQNVTKLKQVYLNEETGEIIDLQNAPTKELNNKEINKKDKTFEDIVDDVANTVENFIDKK